LRGHFVETKPLYPWTEDIICLLNHFYPQKKVLTKEEAKKRFLLYDGYPFPGNVRELLEFQMDELEQVADKIERFWNEELKKVTAPKFRIDDYPIYNPIAHLPDKFYRLDASKYNKEQNNYTHSKRQIIRRLIKIGQDDFREALKLLRNDKFDVVKLIRAFEIVTLRFEAGLKGAKIAEILRINRVKLSSNGFKSEYGFDLPNIRDHSDPPTPPGSTKQMGLELPEKKYSTPMQLYISHWTP
jgi:hypothetical protein